MYHKMRLLVFGDNMEKQMDFPVEDSQDYFSDEDDGSFRILNWRIKKEIFILITSLLLAMMILWILLMLLI